MSQESSIKSHVLSDILQATGINTEESDPKTGSQLKQQQESNPINLATTSTTTTSSSSSSITLASSSKGGEESPSTAPSSVETLNQTPRTQVLLTREGLKSEIKVEECEK